MDISNKRKKQVLRGYPERSPEELAEELELNIRDVKKIIQDAGLDKKTGDKRASFSISDLPWKEVGIFVLALAVVGAIGYGAFKKVSQPSLQKLKNSRDFVNVLLITVDTCRPDHLGAYGYKGVATPNIDALAGAGVRFNQALTHSPLELPAYATLLTGTLPPYHGALDNASFHLPPDMPTLPKALKAQGVLTSAIVSSMILHHQFGLDQGFDSYDDKMSVNVRSGDLGYDEIPAADVTDKAINWITQNKDTRFFLWLHYYDPHVPYSPPEDLIKTVKNPYDAEIASVDRSLGQLFKVIDNLDLRRKTIIILTSDHGEGLGEHNEGTHGIFIYDTTMRVPLIISLPHIIPSGTAVDRPVGLVDITPTILEALGMEKDKAIQGRSLLPLIYGDASWTDVPIYMENYSIAQLYGWASLQAVRSQGYKYIRAPQPELYNLTGDAGEKTNIIDKDQNRASAMSQDLDQIIAKAGQGAPPGNIWFKELDSRIVSLLNNMGEMWSLPPLLAGSVQKNPDPKEMTNVAYTMNDSSDLIARGKLDNAVNVLEEALKKNPDNIWIMNRLGQLYGQMAAQNEYQKNERISRATGYLRRAIETDPNYLPAYYNMAALGIVRGIAGDVVSLMNYVIEKCPLSYTAYNFQGHAFVMQKEYDKAAYQFVKSLELHPMFAAAHANLAVAYSNLKRWDESKAQMEQAVQLDPRNESYKKMMDEVSEKYKLLQSYKEEARQNKAKQAAAPAAPAPASAPASMPQSVPPPE